MVLFRKCESICPITVRQRQLRLCLRDRALDYFGPRKTVLIGGYVGGLGLGASIAISVPISDTHPILALIIINLGFACAGLGIGPMFPAYIIAASQIPGIASSVAIARVGVIGIAGYFIGPSITGAIMQGCTS